MGRACTIVWIWSCRQWMAGTSRGKYCFWDWAHAYLKSPLIYSTRLMRLVLSDSMDALVQNSKEHNLAANLKPLDGGMHPCVIVPDYHEVYHVARPMKWYQTASTFVEWELGLDDFAHLFCVSLPCPNVTCINQLDPWEDFRQHNVKHLDSTMWSF